MLITSNTWTSTHHTIIGVYNKTSFKLQQDLNTLKWSGDVSNYEILLDLIHDNIGLI